MPTSSRHCAGPRIAKRARAPTCVSESSCARQGLPLNPRVTRRFSTLWGGPSRCSTAPRCTPLSRSPHRACRRRRRGDVMLACNKGSWLAAISVTALAPPHTPLRICVRHPMPHYTAFPSDSRITSSVRHVARDSVLRPMSETVRHRSFHTISCRHNCHICRV